MTSNHSTRRLAVVSVALLTVLAALLYVARPAFTRSGRSAATVAAAPAPSARQLSSLHSLPLAFEPNQGQTDPRVQYLAHGKGFSLFLTPDEAVVSLVSRSATGTRSAPPKSAAVRMQLVHAKSHPTLRSETQIAGVSNYLRGSDATQWHTAVPHYARVNYQDVYPGVNLAFHGAQQQMEFDFVVAPGADASPIAMRFAGADQLNTNAAGDLVLSSAAGNLRLHKPVAYQQDGATRTPVEAAFVVRNGQVAFALGAYDRSRELVIDPALTYSDYLGGSAEDRGHSIAVDTNGDAYVAGSTASSDFPTGPGLQLSFAGGVHDAFVTKIDTTGVQVFSTYIGGTKDDSANGIAVDSTTGATFVVGSTASSDFPTTAGSFLSTFNPSATIAAFVLELNSGGTALTYSTFMGTGATNVGIAIAIDSADDVYVTGQTNSSSFPTKPNPNPIQPTGFAGDTDVFVSKLHLGGAGSSDLVYSTYMGGVGGDTPAGIALDASKNAYIAGVTLSSNFPNKSAFDTSCGSDGACNGATDDGFVAEVAAAGNSLVYSSYLGGAGKDDALGIAVDSTGAAYVSGLTASADFPTAGTPFQGTLAGTQNAFVSKVAAGGASLTYSTYLGGSGTDAAYGIAIDSSNNAYVTGQTSSATFPVVSALTGLSTLAGTSDAFVSELDGTGTNLVFSTYLGGTGGENTGTFAGIAISPTTGDIYVAGDTNSNDFPTAGSAGSSFGGGTSDAFVARISASAAPPADFLIDVSPTTATVTHGSSAGPFTVTLTPVSGFASAVTISCLGLPTGASCGSPTIGAGGTSTTFSITTTAGSQPAPITGHLNAPPATRGPLYAVWLIVPGLALMGAGIGARSSRMRLILGTLVGCVIFSGLLFLSACGGGGGGGGGIGSSGSTPPGTYTITVKGTSGGTSHNAIHTISLTVN